MVVLFAIAFSLPESIPDLLFFAPIIFALGYAGGIRRAPVLNPVSRKRLLFLAVCGAITLLGIGVQNSLKGKFGTSTDNVRFVIELAQIIFLLHTPYKFGEWMVWQDRQKRAAERVKTG